MLNYQRVNHWVLGWSHFDRGSLKAWLALWVRVKLWDLHDLASLINFGLKFHLWFRSQHLGRQAKWISSNFYIIQYLWNMFNSTWDDDGNWRSFCFGMGGNQQSVFAGFVYEQKLMCRYDGMYQLFKHWDSQMDLWFLVLFFIPFCGFPLIMTHNYTHTGDSYTPNCTDA